MPSFRSLSRSRYSTLPDLLVRRGKSADVKHDLHHEHVQGTKGKPRRLTSLASIRHGGKGGEGYDELVTAFVKDPFFG